MSRIRANTVALAGSFFITAFLGFLQVKIVTNSLDQISVGVWSAVIAVGALFGALSEIGLPLVLVRYGAKYDAEGHPGRLLELWSLAVRVFLVALLVVTGLLIAAGPGIAALLGGGKVDRWLLVLGYVTVACGSLRALNSASFRGLRRMTAVAILEILFALSVTFVLYHFRYRLTVPLVLVISLASGFVWAVVGMSMLARILSRLRGQAESRPAALPVASEIRSYWQGAAVAGIVIVATEQLDRPLLAGLVSFQELAVFHVATKFALFARTLIYVPFQVMQPEVTHKWESGRREELRADMELFTKLALGLGLCMVVLLALFARPLLLLASTPEFLAGAAVLWMFTAALPLMCLHQPMVMFLRATGRVWLASAGDAAWLAIYLGVGSILVRPFGLAGFVGGQVLASVSILATIVILFRRLGLPRPTAAFYIRSVLLSGAVWLAASSAGRLLPILPWWQLSLLAILVGLVGNFLLVRGRYLTRAEEERVVELLAGRGIAGRTAQLLLSWPWGRTGRERA